MRPSGFLILLGTLLICSCQESYLDDSEQALESDINSGKKEVLWMTKSVEPEVSSRAVLVKDKFWKMGQVIRIKFLNGSEVLQNDVKRYASVWSDYVGVGFKYVGTNENADVKIGFDMDEAWMAWSTIGTDCKSIPQNQPSLNFVWLDSMDEMEKKAEILRGFGNILGLAFEHQNPGSGVVFKPTADIAGEYNLSPEQVEDFKKTYTSSEVSATPYDVNSIMVLTIPRNLLVNPMKATNRKYELSEGDKNLMQKIYPSCIKATFCTNSMRIIVLASDWLPVPGSHERVVDWGDGQWGPLYLDDSYTKNYETAEERVIRFYGQDTLYKLLYCQNMGLRSIDVTKDTALETLQISDGELISLDVSHNPHLKQLACDGNPLRSLNLQNNRVLEMLTCFNCNLTALDISSCPELEILTCNDNPIGQLDLSNNLALTSINCSKCGLATLDIEQCVNLSSLYCTENLFSLSELSKIAKQLPDRKGKSVGNIEVNNFQERLQIEDECKEKNWVVIYVGGSGFNLNSLHESRVRIPLRDLSPWPEEYFSEVKR